MRKSDRCPERTGVAAGCRVHGATSSILWGKWENGLACAADLMQNFYASVESALALAAHAEAWNWKEEPPKA
jgi:hypothetical protein